VESSKLHGLQGLRGAACSLDFFLFAEPVSPHLFQERSNFSGVTIYRDHRINAALRTHRCLSLTVIVVIDPFIDGCRRINLTAVEASAPFTGKEVLSVQATSLVRGYMILGMGAVSGAHFSGNV
jgi:hypothetical protein